MHVHYFFIDKITNSIEERISGKSFPTVVLPATETDIRGILKKHGWQFKWNKECKMACRQVFKLLIEGETQIQGLISLELKDPDCYIEMHLIESAPQNRGRNKQYLGVPGNLVAFACNISFEGYEGFVAITAKTRLIDHYQATLGAQLVMGRNRMVIFPLQSKFLVNSYYKNSKNE